MAVIWGLDLHELQWYKFKSSYMFKNRDYHLRRTKFIVYQCAMIFMVVSESIGTAALSDYVDQQTKIQRLHSSARVHNDNFVGIASYNIFVGIYIATIFGAGFFFDLFFPERWEPVNIRWWWRACAVFGCIMCLADALAFTVIVACYKSTITADSQDAAAIAQEKLDQSPNIVYRHNGRAVASVVLLWIGLVSTIASTIVMFAFYKHYGTYGAKSLGGRFREQQAKEAKDFASPMPERSQTSSV